MKLPSRLSLVFVSAAALSLAGVIITARLFPAEGALTNEQIEALRQERQTLSAWPAQVPILQKRHDKLVSQLWDQDRLAAFKASLPAAWSWQALGPDPDAPDSRRFALSRSDAVAKDWPEILAVLGQVEGSPCARIDSTSLSSVDGRFQRCMFTFTLHFQPGTFPNG